MQTQSLGFISWQAVPLCKNKGAASFCGRWPYVSLYLSEGAWVDRLYYFLGGSFVLGTNHTPVCGSSEYRICASSCNA